MHIKGKEYQFSASSVALDAIYGQVKIGDVWFRCTHSFNGDIKIIDNYYVYTDQDNKFKLEI